MEDSMTEANTVKRFAATGLGRRRVRLKFAIANARPKRVRAKIVSRPFLGLRCTAQRMRGSARASRKMQPLARGSYSAADKASPKRLDRRSSDSRFSNPFAEIQRRLDVILVVSEQPRTRRFAHGFVA
jgi:hypothetical protein